MGYNGKNSLYNFISDAQKTQSHQQISHNLDPDDDVHLSPNSTLISPSQDTVYSIIPPHPSPASPWTLSPLHTPSTPLLFHCVASLHRQEGTVHAIAAMKDIVFTGSESTRIRAWHQPDCIERGYLRASSGDVRAILAYGNMVFTSHKDCKIRMWNVTVSDNFKAKKISTLPRKKPFFVFPDQKNGRGHKDFIFCMAYYNAEGLLYTGSWDKTVKVWRVWDSSCVDTFLAHEENINGVVVNQEDGVVFTCSCDGLIKIWRRIFGQSSHTLTMTLESQSSSPINTIALSTSMINSCVLYSGSSDGYINFWEKEEMSGRFNHGGVLQGHRFSVLCLVVIEKLIFSGSEDTTIRVWRREEGNVCVHECLAVVDAHRGPVKCLAVSLELEKEVSGFLVYSAGLDQNFKVWRVKVILDEGKSSGACLDAKTMKFREFEMSPVLSPSWVEKKLCGTHPFH